ncbi:hypothetical protein DI270_023320 [Microbispora triticiradicis]|uniref:Glycosyltransferase subfamily 4-like N-terminal domain-containing protein n=1 Tax=Microbispora triticiradicis TaxID=2200763 RepID=A0ABX9LF85_9ACTN|nr:glycosyltransferase family 4 protein [Microbispora triticiradicis]RGA02632.1 hypothetical protein DI270_023320 [Microbispora triticiradicis]
MDGPARVYVVCSEVPPGVVGGLGRYAERIMAALRDLGVPIEVFGAARRGAAPPAERRGDVTLRRLPTPGYGIDAGSRVPAALRRPARVAGLLVFNVRAAARILRAEAARRRPGPRGERRSGEGCAVVAVHDWMGCVAGILCGALGRLPVVFHVHTRELNAPGARRSAYAVLLDLLETAQARTARVIVVPSARMRDDLAAQGWPGNRLVVVPHGYEDPDLLRLAALPDDERERTRAEIRRRYLPGGRGRLVVFAGRPSPHKGVGTLIRAVPRVVSEHGDTRFVLVGAGLPQTADAAEVARLIERTGTGGHVVAGNRFLPSPEVFAHFLAADVCSSRPCTSRSAWSPSRRWRSPARWSSGPATRPRSSATARSAARTTTPASWPPHCCAAWTTPMRRNGSRCGARRTCASVTAGHAPPSGPWRCTPPRPGPGNGPDDGPGYRLREDARVRGHGGAPPAPRAAGHDRQAPPRRSGSVRGPRT